MEVAIYPTDQINRDLRNTEIFKIKGDWSIISYNSCGCYLLNMPRLHSEVQQRPLLRLTSQVNGKFFVLSSEKIEGI